MAYVTLDEAKQYLGDKYLSAYININTELVDDTILQQDITDVTSMMDHYIKKLYNGTIVGTESLQTLRYVSLLILDHVCYRRYDSAEMPDSVNEGLKEGKIILNKIMSGDLILSDEDQSPRASGFVYNYNSANTDGTGRKIFDRDSMRGY